ncbi:leucine zipper domain-containing protein [Actinoplanes philippinensis]|uniref:leucine zipper domain-containing protein n=1 Tax=Actinoplanes philippinensis TaxID=35752 RepID=UPI0033FC99D2
MPSAGRDAGASPARAAEHHGVSWRIANKGADRCRTDGEAGPRDRSSRPHRRPRSSLAGGGPRSRRS